MFVLHLHATRLLVPISCNNTIPLRVGPVMHKRLALPPSLCVAALAGALFVLSQTLFTPSLPIIITRVDRAKVLGGEKGGP